MVDLAHRARELGLDASPRRAAISSAPNRVDADRDRRELCRLDLIASSAGTPYPLKGTMNAVIERNSLKVVALVMPAVVFTILVLHMRSTVGR